MIIGGGLTSVVSSLQCAHQYNIWISLSWICETKSWCRGKYWTCVIVSSGRDELEGGWRLQSGTNALQQGEERVPVVCTVDISCISLQELMKAIGYLPTDPGQHMRFHHQQQTQGEEYLWVRDEEGWKLTVVSLLSFSFEFVTTLSNIAFTKEDCHDIIRRIYHFSLHCTSFPLLI